MWAPGVRKQKKGMEERRMSWRLEKKIDERIEGEERNCSQEKTILDPHEECKQPLKRNLLQFFSIVIASFILTLRSEEKKPSLHE